jgi:argininosuccinate synthase
VTDQVIDSVIPWCFDQAENRLHIQKGYPCLAAGRRRPAASRQGVHMPEKDIQKRLPETDPRQKIVLAYSGGLDTSIIIPWLKENYDCEVIAFVADVGQGEDMEEVAVKAIKTGASKVVVEGPARGVPHRVRLEVSAGGRGLRTQVPAGHLDGAAHHRQVPGGSCAGRRRRGRGHGCTGKGNDQVRFEHAFLALAPELQIIAPWREWI